MNKKTVFHKLSFDGSQMTSAEGESHREDLLSKLLDRKGLIGEELVSLSWTFTIILYLSGQGHRFPSDVWLRTTFLWIGQLSTLHLWLVQPSDEGVQRHANRWSFLHIYFFTSIYLFLNSFSSFKSSSVHFCYELFTRYLTYHDNIQHGFQKWSKPMATFSEHLSPSFSHRIANPDEIFIRI